MALCTLPVLLLALAALSVLPWAAAQADDPFVTTWRTTAANESITIPAADTTSAYTIDWGDGTVERDVYGYKAHTYASSGNHTITISGDFPGIRLADHYRSNAAKLVSIDSWGDIKWKSMRGAFHGASNMVYRATDTPDLSGVTDMSSMFYSAYSFNGDISGWDVSQVTDMRNMFRSASSFNGDISGWDVSQVTDMYGMFAFASSFNGDISGWDVSSVTQMADMFMGASSFNQNLGDWYIVLDNTSINYRDAPGIVGRISAQNSFLDGQNPVYGIGSGGDSDSFEMAGDQLRLKVVPTKDTYSVSVTTTGDFGRSNSKMAEVTIAGAPANWPPVVDAGPDQAVLDGSTVTLSGTATDRDGDDLTYQWSHDSTGLAIAFFNATAISTTFTAPQVDADTTVTFTLNVSDGHNAAVTDQVRVIITSTDAAFVTTWRTTADNESITIPATDTTSAYTIYWGDGTVERNVSGVRTHTYASSGDHTITISGDFPGIRLAYQPSAAKLVSIDSWGDIKWKSMRWAFWEASNMVYRATDTPDLSGVTDMSSMFRGASSFDGDLSSWDVSSVTDMSRMFWGASSFDGDLSSWDVSSVTDTSSMFWGASSFDGDLSSWDVSSVTDMGSMFRGTSSFNQNLGDWYIVLDNTSINYHDAPGIVGRISAQNSFLDGQNPVYGIGSGGDSDSFEMVGNQLRLKVVPTKDTYSVSVTTTGDFGRSNSKMVEVTIAGAPANWPPVVDAGPDQAVLEGSTVTLSGTATDHDGDDLTYQWSHDSTGLAIAFFNATAISTTFTAPQVDADTTVTFTLNVSDGHNAAVADQVRVIITSTDAAFVTTWRTTADNESITIPAADTTSAYTIDWGDGTVERNVTGDRTHTYASSGDHTITISGDFPGIRLAYQPSAAKLVSIDSWGDIKWKSMRGAFWGASNMVYRATDTPDLSGVTDMSSMFRDASSFNGDLSSWDVSSVTDMTGMFWGASSFDGDISSWDVSSVTNMAQLFSGASSFNGDLSSWDVSQVTGMAQLFSGASSFNGDLSSWDVSQVTYMTQMFHGASSFDGDISSWDVSSVTYMTGMFWGASSFNGTLSSWDVSSVTDMTGMFYYADYFNGDLSSWDVSQVTGMGHMFWGASYFNGDLSSWDVSSVTDMSGMFLEASSFNGTLSSWDVSSVTDMSYMFQGTYFNGDISSWDVSSVTDMSYMFAWTDSFNGDLSSWDVSSVTDMNLMFWKASSFNGDLSSWDVSSVTDMYGMFLEASSFNGDLSSWDVSSVTGMSGMFEGASSFNGNISSWDVSSVTDTFSMFRGASSFNGDISSWDVSQVTDMYRMFEGASSFNGNISSWDVSSVTDMTEMFYEASSFNGDISSWDVSSVTNMYRMFNGASSFSQNLGNWYIVLDKTFIADGDATRAIGNITAQNSYLAGQSPTYAVSSGGSDFEVVNGTLKLKHTPDYSNKSEYSVTITASGSSLFGTDNSRSITVSVTESGMRQMAPQMSPGGAPTPPAITGVDQVKHRKHTVTGTADPNTDGSLRVVVFVNGQKATTATPGGDGAWSATVKLEYGNNTVTAKAKLDGTGYHSSYGEPYSITLVDPTPGVPAITGVDQVKHRKHTVTGTADPNTDGSLRVVVFVNGQKATTATPGGDGAWSATVKLEYGSNAVTARAVGAAGHNSAYSGPYSITLVDPTPAVPAITGVDQVKHRKHTVTGTADPNTDGSLRVVVFVNGQKATTATPGGDGAWSATVKLEYGSNAVTARAVGAAGHNSAYSGPYSITLVDPTPAVPEITGVDQVKHRKHTVTGTADPNTDGSLRVDIFVNGQKATTATPDGDGAWSATVKLEYGSNAVTARAVGAAGHNSAYSGPYSITLVDPTPAVPEITGVDQVKHRKHTVTGTADPNTDGSLRVDIFVNGQKATTATPGGDGAWSATVKLEYGSNAVTARAVGAAGHNSAYSEPYSITLVDPTPAVPVIANAGPRTTNQTTAEIHGTADPNSMVIVRINDAKAATFAVDASGKWGGVINLDVGENSVTAKARATTTSDTGAKQKYDSQLTAPFIITRTG